ncbi:hypothetical protein LCGC14_3069680, partial [marine sediment metagenome]
METVVDQACSENQSIRGLSDLYSPEEPGESHMRDIADVLLEMGKLTPETHARLRQEQLLNTGTDARTILLKTGLIDADSILEARAKLNGLEFRRIEPETIEKEAFEKLDIDFIKSSGVMPIATEDETLIVATCDPANVFAIEDVKRQVQMSLRVVA